MSTTRERIETDIKENVSPLLNEYAVDLGLATEEVITEGTEILSRKLQNLSTAGTKAGEQELAVALEAIQRKVAKKIVEHVKKRYNL